MRKHMHLITVAVALALAAGATTALAASGHSSAAAKPKLTTVSTNPLTVRGRHFRAERRVRVRLEQGMTLTRTVRTDRHGTFKVDFQVPADRCTVWVVTATQGRTTAILRGPRTECAPMGTP